ncbi:hypothetical protein ACS5PU_04390 [Pedobacter sp. GSP4]|uniref:hypothetical protein n=1 Tax=Pedobacter sp. GSP4 TaxID=3453716 RepID=UPI003EEF7A19
MKRIINRSKNEFRINKNQENTAFLSFITAKNELMPLIATKAMNKFTVWIPKI